MDDISKESSPEDVMNGLEKKWYLRGENISIFKMNAIEFTYVLLTVACVYAVIMNQEKQLRSYEPRSFPCVLCGKRTKPGERRTVSGDGYKGFRKYLFKNFMINTKENDVSCNKCRIKYYKSSHTLPLTHPDEPAYQPPAKKTKQQLSSPRNISLPLQSVKGPSHSSCCICKKRGHKFVVVSASIRYTVFLAKNVIIPAGSRCCPGHIVDDTLKDGLMSEISDLKSESQFNRTDILNLIHQIREIALKNQTRRVDFDLDSCMSDADYYNLLGLDKVSFDDICTHINDIRSSKNRSLRTCIGIYLTKLRSGMSNRLLSTVFNVGIDSIKRSIRGARKALAKDFTANYIGFEHISRKDISERHTTGLAKTLFGGPTDPVILVIDGTYIYIQKSSQFSFQRRSFSMHKKRPLVKPMMIVTSTGYYVSVLGSYLSDTKNNDAKILIHALSYNVEKMKNWLQEDDVMVVDRGFRDSLDFLHELGIKTEMPCFLDKGKKQHDVQDSNSSRLTTKIRWIVESANGRMKQWKYLANVVPNSQIPYIGEDVRLVCAMSNKYLKPLCTSNESDETYGCRLLYLAKQSNILMERVKQEELDRQQKSKWEPIDASDNSLILFPKLDEEDLRNITLGIYQLKLAKSYNNEHQNNDGQYDIMINRQDKNLLMAKIQSRHVTKKAYKLWIDYDELTIKGWYCQCKSGTRVVGTCAHIAATIWYLGFARYHQLKFNSQYDWSLCLKDAAQTEPQLVDTDDDGDVEE